MRLVVPRTDALVPVQAAARLTADDVEEPDMAPLIDRLANRLGADHVYRVAPVDSDVPERSVRHVREKAVGTWPADLPRPVRLLDPPQPVEAMALLPDHPPMAFTWRRVRHRVRRADGPERIAGNGGSAAGRPGRCAITSGWKMRRGIVTGCSGGAMGRAGFPGICGGFCMGFFEGGSGWLGCGRPRWRRSWRV